MVAEQACGNAARWFRLPPFLGTLRWLDIYNNYDCVVCTGLIDVQFAMYSKRRKVYYNTCGEVSCQHIFRCERSFPVSAYARTISRVVRSV